MLKSFIDPETWKKVRLTKWEHDKEQLEKELWKDLEWENPFNSDKPLEDKEEE